MAILNATVINGALLVSGSIVVGGGTTLIEGEEDSAEES